MTTDYLKRVESLNCWEHTIHCEPLEGGITNRNFLVEHGNEKLFVRLGEDIPKQFTASMSWQPAGRLMPVALRQK